MKGWFGYFLILLLAPALAAAAASDGQQALGLSDHQASVLTKPSHGASKFIPPDEAFRFRVVSAGPRMIRAHWSIRDGYYLYRKRFHFSVAGGKGFSLGTPRFPPGTVKTDPYFGKVEIYHHAVDVLIPVHGARRGARVRLKVAYQGCADAGFCYPPIKHTAEVTLGSAPAGTTGASAGAAPSAVQPPRSEQGRLAGLILADNLPLVMLVFAGLGLLLAFTPCILPMLPILSGLIVGQGKQLTTWRAFSLSLVYVLAMALTYTAAGVVAGLSGANLQAAFQAPAIIALFSAVFVALALAMFGVYELQMPAFIQGRVAALSNRQRRGTLVGAGTMGVLSALIVGPCLAAPLAGALLVIGRGGDPLRGGLALFALSLGMGLPLLAIGASAGRLLPRGGPWMEAVKKLFGLLLLGVAIWFLRRILPNPLVLGLWGVLAGIAAVTLGVFRPVRLKSGGWHLLGQGLGAIVLIYGLTMVVGAAAGGGDPFKPLAPFSHNAAAATSLTFKPIHSVRDLRREVAAAARRNRPVMLDFYADWCVSCKEMDHGTFRDARVRRALRNVVLLRADVTANDAKDRALLKHFGIFGPPSIMFFGRGGAEIKRDRVVGYLSAGKFLPHIERATASSPALVDSHG
jgi:thiol:disulfide interchange protein DsbD